MKQLLLALLLAAPTLALAQTVKPDQYCILSSEYARKGNFDLQLNSGTGELAASLDQVTDAARVKALTNPVDALNYLSSRGWEVISVTRGSSAGTTFGTSYYLRRHQPQPPHPDTEYAKLGTLAAAANLGRSEYIVAKLGLDKQPPHAMRPASPTTSYRPLIWLNSSVWLLIAAGFGWGLRLNNADAFALVFMLIPLLAGASALFSIGKGWWYYRKGSHRLGYAYQLSALLLVLLIWQLYAGVLGRVFGDRFAAHFQQPLTALAKHQGFSVSALVRLLPH